MTLQFLNVWFLLMHIRCLPYKGLGMFTFDKQDDPKKHINVLKDFFNTIRIDFLARQVIKLE